MTEQIGIGIENPITRISILPVI